MCFGIMTYYPREVGLDTCVSYKQMSECDIRDWQEELNGQTDAASAIHISSGIFVLMLTAVFGL